MSYYQKYYKKNREQILLKYKEKHREKKPTLCECGETINYRGLYQHKKTVKHKNKIVLCLSISATRSSKVSIGSAITSASSILISGSLEQLAKIILGMMM